MISAEKVRLSGTIFVCVPCGERLCMDVASPEVLLRLIQSVPSPRAEPIN